MTQFAGRRRVLTLLAASAALAPAIPALLARESSYLFEWTGTALGARVHLRFVHDDESAVRTAAGMAAAEIDRLESIFSLYRPDSELCRLNRDGVLKRPSLDLVALLREAAAISALSGGAFDVTVQPLWQLYRDHFVRHPSDELGPDPRAIAAARALVDFTGVDISRARISLAKPGMAVTLNGIAQGYITDRVADLLRDRGFPHVLVDLGEIRALGQPPGGEGWPVRIEDPTSGGGVLASLLLHNRAVATSQGRASSFDGTGRHHHIFDPASGRSANLYRSVSIVADRATSADGLSTALSVMPQPDAAALVARLGRIDSWMLTADGKTIRIPGGAAG